MNNLLEGRSPRGERASARPPFRPFSRGRRVEGFRARVAVVLATLMLLAGSVGCTGLTTAAESAREADVVPAEDANNPVLDLPKLTEAEKKANVDSFNYVWETIRDKHYDEELNGIDWNAAKEELLPQVEAAESKEVARSVMRQLLGRLGESHFGIVSDEAYEEMAPETADSGSDPASESSDTHETSDESSSTAKSGSGSAEVTEAEGPKPARKLGGAGDLGIEIRVLDGAAVVVGVLEDSPGEKAGVQVGWAVKEIDGRDVARRLERVEEYVDSPLSRDITLSRAIMSRLGGQVGDEVQVVFLDDQDSEVEMKIPLEKLAGTRSQLGHMPAVYVTFDSKRVKPKIGYITFNMFMDPMNLSRSFREAMEGFLDCDGIVLDLRGNPGGIGAMAMGMAGWFIDDDTKQLGTMHMRAFDLNFIVNPRPETFSGPLAILVDGCSGSTTEIFAGGMKDLGRAQVFGTRSCGMALPSVFEKLPNGDRFQYAIADYVSTGGERLEGVGVIPHAEVKLKREELLEGKDAVIEAAIQWIEGPKSE